MKQPVRSHLNEFGGHNNRAIPEELSSSEG